jgi:hypothetical protein
VMDLAVRDTILSAGADLSERLRHSEPIPSLEAHILQRLASLQTINVLVSGCNRSSVPGHNLIHAPRQGPHVVVLNPIDGYVNYARGSRVFGASISVFNLETEQLFAVVYDGLEDTIVDNVCGAWEKSAARDSTVPVRPVVGVTHMSLSELDAETTHPVSVRSLGSTTVSIMEFLRGHIDLFVGRTKLWNIYWALDLLNQGCLQVQHAVQKTMVTAVTPVTPEGDIEASVHVVCYRTKDLLRSLASTIGDLGIESV